MKNINHNRSKEISEELEFIQTGDHGKYLGVPLIHDRVGRETFEEVIDKVKTRMSSWKCNVLSLTGRATFISLVTSAIPGYIMQTA